MAVNPYERAGRLEKASALELFFRLGRIPLADVERMTEKDWILAAKGARVTLPSEETRRMVMESMRRESVCLK